MQSSVDEAFVHFSALVTFCPRRKAIDALIGRFVDGVRQTSTSDPRFLADAELIPLLGQLRSDILLGYLSVGGFRRLALRVSPLLWQYLQARRSRMLK